MIRTDVGEYRNVWSVIDNAIQLKTTELQHIIIVFVFCHLPGETFTDIPAETDV